jgi:hypothetical protein
MVISKRASSDVKAPAFFSGDIFSLALYSALMDCARLRAAQERREQDPTTQAKAAVEGYLENRSSFGFLKCKYTETDAKTATLEDAIRGANYIRPVVSHNVLLIDGPSVMHATTVVESVVNESKKSVQPVGKDRGIITMPFSPRGYLSDGADNLSYAPVIECANVKSPETPDLGVAETILMLGNAPQEHRPDPRFHLDLVQTGKGVMWPEGLKEIDGRAAVCMKFGDHLKKPTYHFALDLERGFLPLRITLYEGKTGRADPVFYLTHVIKCSKGRWFPERSVRVYSPRTEGGLFTVRETKVTELDVDRRPKRSEFTFKMRAGTTVLNPPQGGRFRLMQEESVDIDDLPGLLEKCRRSIANPFQNTALHPPDPYVWLRWSGFALSAAMVSGLVVYVVRKRFRPT